MTNLECLASLGDTPMFSLARLDSSRFVRPASWWAENETAEDNYEVRERPYHYGQKIKLEVGVVGGLTIYREAF